MHIRPKVLIFAFSLLAMLTPFAKAEDLVVRIGHFPNLTHAQALVARQSTDDGKGLFEAQLPPGTKIEWYAYNAGPSAMEALVLGNIDFTYVGPNPAINAFSKTHGAEVRIISGATLGGAALVVQGNDSIKSAANFKGKKIATPQLGNTQDVAARSWLIANGINVTQTGGDALVIPTENPEQLTLFQSGQIDAAWTVEPWVSRLVREAKGKIFVSDTDSITTILVASNKIAKQRPDVVQSIIKANNEVNTWISTHEKEAKQKVMSQLAKLTQKEVSAELMDAAWPRIKFSSNLTPAALQSSVDAAKKVGFLKNIGDISNIFYVPK